MFQAQAYIFATLEIWYPSLQRPAESRKKKPSATIVHYFKMTSDLEVRMSLFPAATSDSIYNCPFPFLPNPPQLPVSLQFKVIPA